jgi:hypothetical protein
MKKVFLSLLVAAFFATFVVACGNKTDENAEEVDSTKTEELIEETQSEIEDVAQNVEEEVMGEEEGVEETETPVE